MNEFIGSAKYLVDGFKLLIKPGIKRYVVIPLLINSLLFAAAIIYGAGLLSGFIDSMLAQWAWLEWLTWILWPLFVIIALTVIFFCFSIVANLISAPFNGFLAEAVETHLAGRNEQPDRTLHDLTGEIIDGIKAEFVKFTYFLIRAVPLLILFLIPMVNTVAPFIWLLFGAWVMGLEYLEYPMGNHGHLFPEIRKRARQKRSSCMGFGLAVMLLTMLPVLNFLAMPVAVCGATKLWLDKIQEKNELNYE